MSKEAVLIHGWDPNKYNSKVGENPPLDVAWNHRPVFIDQLGQYFDVEYYNLPGFAGQPEPNAPSYNVEDFTDGFATWVESKEKDPEVIIGYSFGGAVALDYKARYNPKTPVVLVAPALKRGETSRSRFAHTAKQLVPDALVAPLKDLYQRLASEYYREGTPFLRATYDQIARRDMTELLQKVDHNDLLLIYGTDDDATPWHHVEDTVRNTGLAHHLVQGGEHNIGQTHPTEIVHAIVNFLQKRK